MLLSPVHHPSALEAVPARSNVQTSPAGTPFWNVPSAIAGILFCCVAPAASLQSYPTSPNARPAKYAVATAQFQNGITEVPLWLIRNNLTMRAVRPVRCPKGLAGIRAQGEAHEKILDGFCPGD